ncbi:3-oxoacyl-ACP synthase [Labilibacter sediminis]|nr:3-oxoacyl-ACP synthase [Labilibacter sediminis]
MTIKSTIKAQLLSESIEILNQKIDMLQDVIQSARESRDSDSKSSVGDKYETNRAMMHIEIDKNQALLNTTLKLKNELSKIKPEAENRQVEFGSVVYTSNGNYFTTVALGKLGIEKEVFYAISLASPIGKAMVGKKKGETFTFQNKEITIKDVL